jgi:hypothetical protein
VTYALVEQHPEEQGERVAAEQLVGGGVLGDAQLGHNGSVPPGPTALLVVGTGGAGPAAARRRQAAPDAAFRSSAMSTIMCSWPPTSRRRPTSSRIVRTSMPYCFDAASAWRRKLE